jgi:hypothetical protein
LCKVLDIARPQSYTSYNILKPIREVIRGLKTIKAERLGNSTLKTGDLHECMPAKSLESRETKLIEESNERQDNTGKHIGTVKKPVVEVV